MELTFSESTKPPAVSRELRLKTRPSGLPRSENFELVDVPMPTPDAGEVLVRNRFFRVSASVRMMISEGAEAVEGVPFPPLRPGDTLGEEAVGSVLYAPAGSGLRSGELVLHHFGFREFACVPIGACTRLDEALPDPAAHLAHGWTAYAALARAARLREGDTVFVSSAAGGIGSLAAQIARSLGAKRVIGSTSTREKGARVVSELGYDAAVVREAGPLGPQLHAAAPDGIDVALDCVGGEQLTAAVNCARDGARIVVVGALSGQLAPEGTGRRAPVQLDSFPILLKRLTIKGYSADDDPSARGEWNERFGTWLRAGSMRFPHERVKGMARVAEAIEGVSRGRYVGPVIVELGA